MEGRRHHHHPQIALTHTLNVSLPAARIQTKPHSPGEEEHAIAELTSIFHSHEIQI